MGFKLTGEPQFRARLEVQKNTAIEESPRITQKAVERGEQLQRDLLDRAVTSWGEYRYSRGRGNSPGRNDTGQMMSDISSDVEVNQMSVVGQWGWLGNIEEYYRNQENGITVPPAHSLLDSYLTVREEWLKDMKDLVG